IAPKLPPDQFRIDVPDYLKRLEGGRSGSVVPGLLAAVVRPAFARGLQTSYGTIVKNVLAVTVPILLTFGTFAATWWYVVIYNAAPAVEASQAPARRAAPTPAAAPAAATAAAPVDEAPQELGAAETEVKESESGRPADAGLEEVGSAAVRAVATGDKVPAHFYQWFWGLVAFSGLLLLIYFWRMDGEQLQILKELIASVVPLGVLTFIVLAVILFGITTATESAGVGALGALYLATFEKYRRCTLWSSLAGLIIGGGLGLMRGDFVTLLVSGSLGAMFAGTAVPWIWDLLTMRHL